MTFEDWLKEYSAGISIVEYEIAKEAWFAGQEQVNKALSWWKVPEGDNSLPSGGPVIAGTKLYTFDESGTWFFYLPPLPK